MLFQYQCKQWVAYHLSKQLPVLHMVHLLL